MPEHQNWSGETSGPIRMYICRKVNGPLICGSRPECDNAPLSRSATTRRSAYNLTSWGAFQALVEREIDGYSCASG
jgi:hypothetical protein